MASSPRPSSSSCSEFPEPPASDFSALPVTALRSKIVEKILENRVTLIIGETGCGKSSQIPQFLLEANMHPVLCTQPRRFAVVAVARMVARTRNCEVGDEVGYHIGHSRVFSSRSKIVFKTAGVLLDEMREKGLNALKYKVIILDEVHERSVESDLVLVCLKQFLHQKNSLRVVLMSATADISRYREYFKDLDRGERVEVLAIPTSGKDTLFQKNVFYLEQVIDLLGINCENPSSTYCSGPNPEMAEADFKSEVHKLIHDLVLHIHKNEPDIEKSILVFLPTYYTLEQQWILLKPFSETFRVHILHRSIDTDQALKAMKIWKSHRKVILATNIAESSVTIPKVGYVIDSCRSLKVFWDSNRKTDSGELVWVSKSQAEQRRGRTGRTCDGFVYRLVTGSFYGQLDNYESPAILTLSLRKQVLLICSAESIAINEPKALLRKAMDPPNPDVVKNALDLLIDIHALEKSPFRGRHKPTFYGRLLASFSLSLDASLLVLKFGDVGMLREGILFGILMDQQPLPILRPFGQDSKFMEYTDAYYSCISNTGLGRKEVLYMSNFFAFQFWQCAFKDKCRLEQLQNIYAFQCRQCAFNDNCWLEQLQDISKLDEVRDNKILLPKIEEEWCSSHHLVLTALQQITEAYDEILNTMHRYRPKSLVISNGAYIHHDQCDFQHICQLNCIQNEDAEASAVLDDNLDHDEESKKCVAVPFVGPYDLHSDEVARKFASIVKQMRIQLTEEVSRQQNTFTYDNEIPDDGRPPLCRYFVSGFCNRGSQCSFSHSLEAKKPVCKFFFSLQGCRNGEACFFSHDSDSLAMSSSETSLCSPEDEDTNAESLLKFFPAYSDGYVLLLEDFDLYYSSSLAGLYDPSFIVCTTSQIDFAEASTGFKVLSGLSHPYQTILSREEGENSVPWNDVKCVLWFPRFGNEYEEGQQKNMVQTTFNYLAIRLMTDVLCDVQVILTMNNLRFSQLQVEKMARDNYFFLRTSFPFDESSFGLLFDEVNSKNPMIVSKAVSYVFDFHPLTAAQFGDHTMIPQCWPQYVIPVEELYIG